MQIQGLPGAPMLVQQNGFLLGCFKNFYELIKRVATVVADFFKTCANCLFPETSLPGKSDALRPPEPILQPPVPLQTPKDLLLLYPDKFTEALSDLEFASCPEVPPIPTMYSRGSIRLILQAIKDSLRDDSSWIAIENRGEEDDLMIEGFGQKFAYSGPKNNEIEKIVRENAYLLVQEDFIQLLKEIEPSEPSPQDIYLPWGRGDDSWIDASSAIDRALPKCKETAQKLRLARLALVWVIENRANRTSRPDPSHPFQEIFKSLEQIYPSEISPTLPGDYLHDPCDSHYLFCARQVIGFQELTRILPLLKAFAAEKKQIRLIHPSYLYREALLEVNPLRDFVLWISQGYTRIYTYRSASSIELPLKNPLPSGPKSATIETRELVGDKLIQGANLCCAAYQKAKEKGDEKAFFMAMDKMTICFDKRVFDDLSKYLEKYKGLEDFGVDLVKMKGDFPTRIAEYRRVFASEQCALFCQRESGFYYFDFREKFDKHTLDANDSKIIGFYQNYFTENRFRAWLIDKDAEPYIDWIKTEASSDENWEEIRQTMASLCIGWEKEIAIDLEP